MVSKFVWRAQENNRKIMGEEARRGAPGRFLQLRHGQTHYGLDGDPDHPLLICIHGWSTASYVWDPLKPSLIAKSYRVLTYDLYGRGYSDRPDVDHSAELYTGQLTELLDSLALNNTSLNVIGYSMGGAIAARFVSEQLDAVDRLLLIAPAGMAVQRPTLRAFARRIPQLSDSPILALFPLLLRRQFRRARKGFESNASVGLVFERQLRELGYRGYLPSLLSSLKGILSSQMEEEHRKIAGSNVFVRALFADQDKTIPFPKAKRLFDQWNPNEVSKKISVVGHAVTYTHPERIINELDDFL